VYKWNYIESSRPIQTGTTNGNIKGDDNSAMITGIAIAFSLFGACMIASLIACFLWYRKKQREGQIQLVDPKYDQVCAHPPFIF
jgi:hypothetical protein